MINLSRKTMHSRLKDQLLIEIKKSGINDKLPPERVLAENHGVCRATVAKVMSELERDGYIMRRPGKGTFIAPEDKTVLGSPKNGAGKGEIIIVYPDYFSFNVWEQVHLTELQALTNNLHLINYKYQRESKLENIFEIIEGCQNLQGIIIMTSAPSLQILEKLENLDIPIVFLQDIAHPGIATVERFVNLYEVKHDYKKAGYLKMDYLLKKGHRQIAYVRNEPIFPMSPNSLAGIKQAFYDYGLRLKDLVVTDSPKPWECSKNAGYELTLNLLKKKQMTALLYDTIPGSIGGLRALYELGLKCPDDISIITACPENEIEKMSCPILTTVTISNAEIISAAIDIIRNPERIYGKKISIDVKIHEAESVKDLHNPGDQK